MNKIKLLAGSAIGSIAGLVATIAHGQTTVESLFPTASISELAIGFLDRYIDLLLSLWPLFIGVEVVFSVVYLRLRKGRKAIHGKF